MQSAAMPPAMPPALPPPIAVPSTPLAYPPLRPSPSMEEHAVAVLKSLGKPRASGRLVQATTPNGQDVLVYIDEEQQAPPAPGATVHITDMQPATAAAAATPAPKAQSRLHQWMVRHGSEFAFYSQFILVLCYYLVEYLTVLNILNRPRMAISGVPLAVLVLTIANTVAFKCMRRLQLLTVVVEFLCTMGLVVYDDITPRNMDDRHRTEYYDMHAHAAALNFVLLVMYAAVWSAGYRSWIDEERRTQAVLTHRLPHKHSATI